MEVSCGPIEGACRRTYTHSGSKHPATVEFDFTPISIGEPVPDREPSLDPDPEAAVVPDVPPTRVTSPPPP